MEMIVETNQNENEFLPEKEKAKLSFCIKETARLWRRYHLDYNQSGYIVKQTRKELEIKNDKPKSKVIQRLSEAECNSLIDYAYNMKSSYAMILKTLLFTGVRVSELVSIKIEHINFNECELFIERGKGDKERVIPLFKFLSDEIRTYVNDRRAGYLFESRSNTKFSTRRIQQIVSQIGKEVGIRQSIHPHLFRHTIATYLLNKGVPIDRVQMFLGHSKIETTQIYAKTNIFNLKESIKQLEFKDEKKNEDKPQFVYGDPKSLQWR